MRYYGAYLLEASQHIIEDSPVSETCALGSRKGGRSDGLSTPKPRRSLARRAPVELPASKDFSGFYRPPMVR